MIENREIKSVSIRARELAILWGPVILWMGVIFYLSSVSTWTTGNGPPLYQALRKGGHVFEYGVLGLLVGYALTGTWRSRGEKPGRLLARVWWVGVIMSTLYAVSDEVHQAFVPRREFHLTDILIDALSATAALGIWYIVRRRKGNGR